MHVANLDDIRQHVSARHFRRGDGWLGPEYAGCCGTGQRPLIVRCPFKEITDTLFFIGTEMAVEQQRMTIALDYLRGHRHRSYGKGRDKVFVRQTKKAAIQKFLELCQEVLDYNNKERQEVAELRNKAKQGDVAAAISLGLDH